LHIVALAETEVVAQLVRQGRRGGCPFRSGVAHACIVPSTALKVQMSARLSTASAVKPLPRAALASGGSQADGTANFGCAYYADQCIGWTLGPDILRTILHPTNMISTPTKIVELKRGPHRGQSESGRAHSQRAAQPGAGHRPGGDRGMAGLPRRPHR